MFSVGNYTQYFVITYKRKKIENSIYIYVSLNHFAIYPN